jgi:membrane fusion protein (multidrug efflux system)
MSVSNRIVRLSFVILIAVIVAFATACDKGKHAESPPPPLVETVGVVQKDVPIHAEWIGTADGFVNATIRAQVQGYLVKQNYSEGDFIKKGHTLFEIDPRPFEAVLEQAKGVLASQQAIWTVAKANLKRIRPLAAQNAVSQKDLDDAVGSEASAQASVISAQASVDKAALDLSFTRIISPVDGIAGIAKAQIGDLVGPSSTQELTTVSTVDPIKIYVAVSEQQYLKAVQHKKALEPIGNLELILTDGSVYPFKGEFIIADRQVDVKTGTIRVAALFKNPRSILRPGQFARVRAVVATKKGALLVPQRAVTELQGSYQVGVVGPDNKVDIRPVKASDRSGAMWVIDEGLKPGERVIAEGVQKVRQGMPVNPKPFQAQPSPASPAKTEAPPKGEAQPKDPAKTEKR